MFCISQGFKGLDICRSIAAICTWGLLVIRLQYLQFGKHEFIADMHNISIVNENWRLRHPINIQNPNSSLIKMTFILPFGKDFSVMVQVLQMRSWLLQSLQKDVFTQGVFVLNRMALTGAA